MFGNVVDWSLDLTSRMQYFDLLLWRVMLEARLAFFEGQVILFVLNEYGR